MTTLIETPNLVVGREGPAARVTLNRPEKRNALSHALMSELLAALRDASADADVRAIVIEGVGPAFSAGHDLAEMVGRDLPFYRELFDLCTELMETIHRLPQPVIAKVQGIATAAGCQLVASCDLAVAAADARFATPGVRIGLFCSTPMVPLSRAIGRKRALEMLLTGEPIDAATALAWGLVNRVVPAAELEA
jgi:enoyl-CoA hydratase/carnithine racemase